MSKLIVNNRLVDTDDFFRGALKMAHAELKKAVEERDALQAEVAALKQMMKYWYEQDEKPAGLLEVIRGCLPREERER